MFDLFRSRAKAVRIMLGGMLGVIALSMLVYLIPGTGMTTTSDSGDQVIADIGRSSVTVAEIEQQLKNALQNQRLPPELAATYIPQIVDEAIAERAVAYEAEQLGFRISDRDLADTLRSIPAANQPPDQYRQYVEQEGFTVPQFEDNLRLKSYEDSIVNIAMEGIIVTPAEAQDEYRKRNEKIKIDYIGFDPAKLVTTLQATPEEISAYFAKNRGFYKLPETRSVQMIIADQPKVAESIQITDAQVQSYYNAHLDQYRTPERVHARHILLATANKSKDEVLKVQAQAQDLLKQIKGGANFADLAKKYSADVGTPGNPGSAQKGGDLGWVSRGQMLKNIEDVVFSLQPNQLSDVVTTEYGFHILQVLEKQPPRLQSLEEVKSQIVTNLKNQTVFDRMQDLSDQAHAELVKAPQNAQQIAAKLNLSFVNETKYSPGRPLPELGADAQIGATVMALKPGEVTPVMQAGSKLAVAVLIAINPPHQAELSEVEPAVRTNYLQLRAVDLVKEKSAKAAELIKQNGDVQAAAKAVGMEAKSTDFFSRSGAAEGIGSAALLGDLFEKPAGTIFGPMTASNQTVVGKIVERQEIDMSKFAQERDQIVLQLKSKKANDRVSLLRDSVLADLIQRGKVKKHQQVIDRLISQYRG
jgi:peptidyl-prolyl cis-trans isomerase D